MKCNVNKTDCFAYEKREKAIIGRCHALVKPAGDEGRCPFYKPETDKLNEDVIKDAIDVYRDSHQGRRGNG